MAEIGKFTQPDALPTYFIDFLDFLDKREAIQNMRAESAKRLSLAPGHRVLDLGCGIGGATIPLAEITGPDGLAAGVDISSAMIEVATQRASSSAGMEFRVGAACAIPYADKFFDAALRKSVSVFAGPAGGDPRADAGGEDGRANQPDGHGSGRDRSVLKEAGADAQDDIDCGVDHAESEFGTGVAGAGQASGIEEHQDRNLCDNDAARVFPEGDGWFAGQGRGGGKRCARGS